MSHEPTTKRRPFYRQSNLKAKITLTGYFCVLLVVVQVFNTLSQGQWLAYGLQPRDGSHLWGIIFSPFLHLNWSHLSSNLLTLAPLLLLTAYLHWQRALGLLLLWLLWAPGLLVWLFARDGIHVGASGLIYGLLAFLIWFGLTSGQLVRLLIALTLLVLHVGLLWGVLPGHEGLSWEYHLAGFVCGLIAAKALNRPDTKTEQ